MKFSFINPIYNEIKHERILNLNNKESYVIKKIEVIDGSHKEVVAESREIILKKMDLKFEEAAADFDNGLVYITIPKTTENQKKKRKIAIKKK